MSDVSFTGMRMHEYQFKPENWSKNGELGMMVALEIASRIPRAVACIPDAPSRHSTFLTVKQFVIKQMPSAFARFSGRVWGHKPKSNRVVDVYVLRNSHKKNLKVYTIGLSGSGSAIKRAHKKVSRILGIRSAVKRWSLRVNWENYGIRHKYLDNCIIKQIDMDNVSRHHSPRPKKRMTLSKAFKIFLGQYP